MAECQRCGGTVERAFRYCPWCSSPQRVKLTEFFRADPDVEGAKGRALRVSRYLGGADEHRHVRFSVWSDTGAGRTTVEAAVSLDEDEASRLSRFLVDPPVPAALEEEPTAH